MSAFQAMSRRLVPFVAGIGMLVSSASVTMAQTWSREHRGAAPNPGFSQPDLGFEAQRFLNQHCQIQGEDGVFSYKGPLTGGRSQLLRCSEVQGFLEDRALRYRDMDGNRGFGYPERRPPPGRICPNGRGAYVPC